MRRVIVDFKKLTPEILNLLVDKFPDGYGIRDVIKFTNPKGKYVEAVEVSTEDTMYLVKISDELVNSMENHEDEDDIINVELDIDVEDTDLVEDMDDD